MTKKKRENTISNIIIDHTDIKVLIQEYFEQLHAANLTAWIKWTNFLEKYNLKSVQEEMKNLGSPICDKAIEFFFLRFTLCAIKFYFFKQIIF